MHRAALEDDPDKVFALAASGPEALTQTDALGRTILHHTAAAGNTAMMCVVLAMDADAAIDVRDQAGDTALTLALAARKDVVLPTARALLEAGADANLPGRDGHTPLQVVSTRGLNDVVELLRTYGASA